MDAKEQGHDGGIASLAFSKGVQKGQGCLFTAVSLSEVISWLIKIELKQIYCNYLRTQKLQNVFL